ncbi:unnamed protein product, partial [Staurois parvus]
MSGLEGGGKCPDRKGGKVSGLKGGTGRGGKCLDWKGGKVSGLEGGGSVRTGRGGKCPDWKRANSRETGRPVGIRGGESAGLKSEESVLEW